MRTIRVVSPAVTGLTKLETSVTTFKDLKALLKEKGLYKDGMRCIDMNSKVTLEHDEVVLPAGNFDIALTPTKSKAGANNTISNNDIDELVNKVSDAIWEFFESRGERAEAAELVAKAAQLLKGLK